MKGSDFFRFASNFVNLYPIKILTSTIIFENKEELDSENKKEKFNLLLGINR